MRMLIDMIRTQTDGTLGVEQCGFRSGRGCLDQRCMGMLFFEKVFVKGKVFVMDLDKAYGRIYSYPL